jgi:hypothetical protein
VDLSVFLEQVPAAIEGLKLGKEFEIYMYEQGPNRKVVGVPRSGESYLLTCTVDLGDWRPDPSSVEMLRTDLLEMLVSAAKAFHGMLEKTGVVDAKLAGMWKNLCGLLSL